MEQEFPFRPRGKHGFDRDDVINYISQAQQRCNEHLARMEELEAAKNAWYTQAKSVEREKAALVARNRELEEQLDRGVFPRETPGSGLFPAGGDAQLEALTARCQELEQNLFAAHGLARQLQEEKEALEQELEALRAQLDQELSLRQGDAARAARMEQEYTALVDQLNAVEEEKAAYAGQLPGLQTQLSRLAETAEQISTLEAVKSALAEELDAAKEQLGEAALEATAQKDAIAALQRDKNDLSQRAAALAQQEAQTRQKLAALNAEADTLRRRVSELEAGLPENSAETLRSMVLSSFNYSNLYVENNLKTAQFISEATSRNISHVSDSATSLLEQLDAITRSFGDTTDNIRRNIAEFQHELGTIQSGMNRRLSKDRFQVLLDENERLRAKLETELLAELSSEEGEPPAPFAPEAPQLPFADDLPQDYHSYLDE